MSRKLNRRFIGYHPGLFQDKKLILLMAVRHNRVNRVHFFHLCRTIVRYRQINNSSHLMLKFKQIEKKVDLDSNEILVLNRLNCYSFLD